MYSTCGHHSYIIIILGFLPNGICVYIKTLPLVNPWINYCCAKRRSMVSTGQSRNGHNPYLSTSTDSYKVPVLDSPAVLSWTSGSVGKASWHPAVPFPGRAPTHGAIHRGYAADASSTVAPRASAIRPSSRSRLERLVALAACGAHRVGRFHLQAKLRRALLREQSRGGGLVPTHEGKELASISVQALAAISGRHFGARNSGRSQVGFTRQCGGTVCTHGPKQRRLTETSGRSTVRDEVGRSHRL